MEEGRKGNEEELLYICISLMLMDRWLWVVTLT
jgi:hypothetical protein